MSLKVLEMVNLFGDRGAVKAERILGVLFTEP